MPKSLPAQFKALEKWTDWCLPTERERYTKRSESTMAELHAFCDALRPHMTDVIDYLDQFPWGSDIDEDSRNLYEMGMSFMEVTIPVDLKWDWPVSPNSLAPSRIEYCERP